MNGGQSIGKQSRINLHQNISGHFRGIKIINGAQHGKHFKAEASVQRICHQAHAEVKIQAVDGGREIRKCGNNLGDIGLGGNRLRNHLNKAPILPGYDNPPDIFVP